MLYYLYYRMFRFQKNFVGEREEIAAHTAFLQVGMFFIMNLFSISFTLDRQVNMNIYLKENYPGADYLGHLIGSIIAFGVCYLMFYHKGKYKCIIDKIENRNNPAKNKFYSFLAISYQILSVIYLFVAFFLATI